jgi:hypothetical protein
MDPQGVPPGPDRELGALGQVLPTLFFRTGKTRWSPVTASWERSRWPGCGLRKIGPPDPGEEPDGPG